MDKPWIDARCGRAWALAVALAGLAGCRGSSAPQAAPVAVTWEVRGPDGGLVVGAGEDGTATVGTHTLVVRNGRLTANGKDGGAVKAGDKILLDKDGQLYVNGVRRDSLPAERR